MFFHENASSWTRQMSFFLQKHSRPVGLGGNERAPRSTSAGDVSECRWTADPVDHFKT